MNRIQHTHSGCARRAGIGTGLVVMVFLWTSSGFASAETFRSANFIVTASSSAAAQHIAEAAEEYRLTFARKWLGVEPADWNSPCRITIKEQAFGGAGWISFETFRGRAEKVRIIVSGPLDRIVEYVLPHEVAHATLAIAIGRPLPRWADEGVAMLSEPESQQARQRATVSQLAAADQIMPLREILLVADYPEDHRDLLGFYAASHSLTEYLVARGGRRRLLDFVNDGDRRGWEKSVRRHYGLSLHDLSAAWSSWRSGVVEDPPLEVAAAALPTATADSESLP